MNYHFGFTKETRLWKGYEVPFGGNHPNLGGRGDPPFCELCSYTARKVPISWNRRSGAETHGNGAIEDAMVASVMELLKETGVSAKGPNRGPVGGSELDSGAKILDFC